MEANGVGTQDEHFISPQTDGQTERVNLVIQQFLRNYVAADQQDWVDHLELAEFCYNNSEHFTTGSTPFQMVMGKSPIVPMTWATQGQPYTYDLATTPVRTHAFKLFDQKKGV